MTTCRFLGGCDAPPAPGSALCDQHRIQVRQDIARDLQAEWLSSPCPHCGVTVEVGAPVTVAPATAVGHGRRWHPECRAVYHGRPKPKPPAPPPEPKSTGALLPTPRYRPSARNPKPHPAVLAECRVPKELRASVYSHWDFPTETLSPEAEHLLKRLADEHRAANPRTKVATIEASTRPRRTHG